MSQTAQDRQPLLPTHIHSSSTSRLARPKISFPSSSTSALASTENNDQSSSTPSRKWTRSDRVQVDGQGGERQGVPKLSRECLWSEIKCYGSYILPVLIVFGVLVIGASLGAVGWKRGWFPG